MAILSEVQPGTFAPSASEKRYCLMLLTVIYTLNIFDRSIISVLLGPIKADLKLTDSQLGLIAGFGFALLYTLLGVPLARLADRTSRRSVISAGVLLWSVATALGGLAQNGVQLVLARTGVGIGEAAGSAPSYAMLSDYFGKAERTRALSIFSLGFPLGICAGVLVGGWLAHWYDWRVALMLAGVPGIFAAALLRFTVKEPTVAQRLQSAASVAQAAQGAGRVDSMGVTLRFLKAQRSFVFAISASFFTGFTLNGLFVWTPLLLSRVHHLKSSEIGSYLGLALGVSGLIGVYLGGAVVSRLGKTDDRWKVWEPSIACALAFPLLVGMLLSDSLVVSLICMGGGTALCLSILGPLYSAYQSIVKPQMRSFATSIQNLMGTIGGLGTGSLIIGVLNDRLFPTYGEAGIRYSLLFPATCLIPAAVLFLMSSRYINADVRRVSEAMQGSR